MYFKSERSQSLVEFAIVAPLLLMVVFGTIDFARAFYAWTTLNEAAAEAGRTAVRNSNPLPSDSDVEKSAQSHAANISLANPCRNGPLDPSQTPPPNTGWIYITEKDPPATIETTEPLPMDAPGGEPLQPPSGPCSSINPATGNVELQITIRYHFVPFTPIIAQLASSSIVIQAADLVRTEY
jgi:hypothetical protein